MSREQIRIENIFKALRMAGFNGVQLRQGEFDAMIFTYRGGLLYPTDTFGINSAWASLFINALKKLGHGTEAAKIVRTHHCWEEGIANLLAKVGAESGADRRVTSGE